VNLSTAPPRVVLRDRSIFVRSLSISLTGFGNFVQRDENLSAWSRSGSLDFGEMVGKVGDRCRELIPDVGNINSRVGELILGVGNINSGIGISESRSRGGVSGWCLTE